jgi:hypothetical protein
VPAEIQNIVYGSRAPSRGIRAVISWEHGQMSHAFAETRSTAVDVMAPAYEVERELKRDIYRRQLPPLSEIEAIEADVACRIQNAEITGDVRSLREAAHEERLIAELLEEAADQQLDVKSA